MDIEKLTEIIAVRLGFGCGYRVSSPEQAREIIRAAIEEAVAEETSNDCPKTPEDADGVS